MSTDPSYVAEQTGCTISTLLSDQPLESPVSYTHLTLPTILRV